MSILSNARRQPPGQRDNYIRAACGHDSDVSRELRDMLLWEERMGSFLQKPVLHFAELARPFQAGEVISKRFEIVREIGEGGMGFVYEAIDQKRKQRIAIKAAKPGFQRLLSPELEGALRVRHHNICLVNEIHAAQTKYGEIDFLTMEFLDGETLHARLLQGGHLPHSEGLDVICQICAGLRAAHDSEIIHRDLKSANIILSQNADGSRRAVITDFGLASGLTLPSGEMGGTPAYMAPELWEGAKASKASDIYALGVVMYEMVTGARPFPSNGSEPKALKHRPAPPSTLREGLDSRWDAVILQCLDSSPYARPESTTEIAARLCEHSPSAAQVRIDLERVLRQRSQSTEGGHTALEKVQRVAARPYVRRLKRVVIATLAVLLLAACVVGIWWWRRPLAKYAFNKYEMALLTGSGEVSLADISPDGKYLAYTDDESGKQSLWLHQLATAGKVRLLGPVSGLMPGIRFTPDGNYIYFSQADADGGGRSLYRIRVQGGPAEKQPEEVFHDVFYQVAFSPDGKQIVFARKTPIGNSLTVANVDGTNARTLLTFAPAEKVAMPVWSPSGKEIAFLLDEKAMGAFNALSVVSVNGGKERRILHNAFDMFGVAWLPDESGLLITAAPLRTQKAIWAVSFPEAGLRRITNDVADYFGLSLFSAGKRVVSVEKLIDSSLWVSPANDPSRAMQLREGAGRKDGMLGLAWLANDKLVYASEEGDINNQLWTVSRDGHQRRRVTSGIDAEMHPWATRDGRKIVFARVDHVSNTWNIWQTDSQGGGATRLTSGPAAALGPEISPDGTWITYATTEGPWKMSLANGEVTKLASSGEYPTISSDGKWIAFTTWNDQEKKDQIEIVGSDGKAPARFLPFIQEPQVPVSANLGSLPIRWTADGKAITYVRTKDGASNIWAQPIDGSPASQITNFTSMYIWRHAWSPDGKYLVMARGNFSRDAVMLTDAR
jgi:Tol biopolymer transport system component